MEVTWHCDKNSSFVFLINYKEMLFNKYSTELSGNKVKYQFNSLHTAAQEILWCNIPYYVIVRTINCNITGSHFIYRNKIQPLAGE